MKFYMFRTVPLPIIRSFSLYTQQWYMSYNFVDSFRAGPGCSMVLLESCLQTCMTYTIAECTVKTSWWWAEELSETCRVSWQKINLWISASSWFYYKEIYYDARSHERDLYTIIYSFTSLKPWVCKCFEMNMRLQVIQGTKKTKCSFFI
jgi:hypothetical protein